MMRVAVAGFKDLPKIYPIELKSYEYPLEHTALQQVLELPGAVPVIGLISGTGVGWALGQYHRADEEMEINRLAVHPSYRMQGFGRMLVGHLWNEAAKRQCKRLFFMVPEYQMELNDPDSVFSFMERMQFKANGIERDYFWRYGRPYDGIRMERAC